MTETERTQALKEKLREKTNLPIELSNVMLDPLTFSPFRQVSVNRLILGRYNPELLMDLEVGKSPLYQMMTGSTTTPNYDVIEEAAEIIIQGLRFPENTVDAVNN